MSNHGLPSHSSPYLGPVGRYIRLVIGMLLSALGTVLSLRAALGITSWDVFHDGLSRSISWLSFGQAVIVTGVALLLISWLLGIRPGIGTVINMVFIGFVDDALIATRIGSELNSASVLWRIPIFAAGVMSMGIGAAIFISAGLGAGPRDSFQLALSKRFRLPAGLARTMVEGFAVLIGWLLGGNAAWGTVVAVLILGPITQVSFALMRLDRVGNRVAERRDAADGVVKLRGVEGDVACESRAAGIVRLFSVWGGRVVFTRGVALRRPGSGGCGHADDLVPGGESGVHLVAVAGCGESVSAGPKVR
jgi:uncharacterized protein